jgi:transcriptional regulator with XRE-family HTH domain
VRAKQIVAIATDELSTFGELLRRHRLSAGLTQEALAEQAGLSARGIADLERGVRRSPYPETVHRLAGALQLDDQERSKLVAMRRRRSVAAPHTATVETIPLVRRGRILPSVVILSEAKDPPTPELRILRLRLRMTMSG